MGSIPLPEHVAGIVIATDRRSGDRAQFQQGFGIVDQKAGMHLDGNSHAMIGGELGAGSPIRNRYFVPLPLQDLQILLRPWAGYPIGLFGPCGISRTSRKIDHGGNAQFLGQQDRPPADVLIVFGPRRIGMQRVSVTAQRTEMANPRVSILSLNFCNAAASSSTASLQCASPG